MPAVTYRPARPDDLSESVQVYFAARDEMLACNNLPVGGEPAAVAETGFRHVLETGIFEVAESGEGLAAVCHAVVRDGLWFLSSFWVRPGKQGQGIGGPLLRRVWEAGERQGAKVFFVWSSVDRTAMSTYMKLGMLPGTQLLRFHAASPHVVTTDPQALTLPLGYAMRPLEPRDAAAIDQEVRGTRREVDHRFWAGRSNIHGHLVLKAGRPCGYFYVDEGGSIAPAAWLNESDGETVLGLALSEALKMSSHEGASLRLTGHNHLGIRFALNHGFRLTGFSHFLTTGPFGRLDRYAPSGPLLF